MKCPFYQRAVWCLSSFLLLLAACQSPARQTTDRPSPAPVPSTEVRNGEYRRGDTLRGRAVHIADGDTFDLLTAENEKIRIRLQGIDAPEKSQDFGTKAKEALGALMQDGRVTAVVSNRDRYKRAVCDIYVLQPGGQEVWVNEQLVRQGLAWHYTDYSKDVRLADAQQAAIAARAGLWVQPRAVAPWDWRKAKREKGSKKKRKQNPVY